MKIWTKEERLVLGINDKELIILEVLQRQGTLNTKVLAHKASLPRVTVIRILTRLKERGFVTKKTLKREVLWSPVDPALQEKRLVDLFGSGNAQQRTTELSEVGSLVIYRGVDAMVASNQKILAAHTGERVLAIEPNGIWKHVAGSACEPITEINRLFAQKKILVEMVFEEGFEQHLEAVDTELARTFLDLAIDIRVVPTRFLDSATEILIFRDQVLFLDWAYSVAVEIKNPSTVRVMRAMFRLLQERGREYKLPE